MQGSVPTSSYSGNGYYMPQLNIPQGSSAIPYHQTVYYKYGNVQNVNSIQQHQKPQRQHYQKPHKPWQHANSIVQPTQGFYQQQLHY